MRTINCCLRLVCLLVLSLFFKPVQAQSKKVKEELTAADYSFAGKKFEEARAAYLKHEEHLSQKQQLRLGLSFLALRQKDPSALITGVERIRKSAEGGYTEAMNTLSYLYSGVMGVGKDSVQEMQWLVRSADAGDAAAMAALGARHEGGVGVAKDKAKAKELYAKAANKGSQEAAYLLGDLSLDEGNLSSALFYLKQSANGDFLPAMLRLGEIYEKGTGLARKDPDEASRWYTKIKNKEGFTDYHSKAYDGLRRIGNTEPSTDLSTVKPKLLQLVGKAGTGFSGLLSQTVEPLDRRSGLGGLLSEDTYYTCTVDLGFKNALIRKEVVQDRDLGNGYRTRAGTFYTYSADIVHSANEATAKRVFDKWKTVLQEAIPQWKGKEDKDPNNSAPNFILSGTMTSGTKVTIYLGLCCPANNQKTVYLRIYTE